MVFDEEKCFDLLKSLTRRCSDTRLVVSETFLKPLINTLMGKKQTRGVHPVQGATGSSRR